ncbi:MAG: ArnT family glycosyltransferase [Geminicoccaceae bacterium]
MALGFLLLAIVLRWPAYLYSVINADEGSYMVVAEAWVRHGFWPYVEVWDRKPLGIFLIYAAVIKSGIEPILGVRLLTSAVVGLTGWTLYCIGRYLFASKRIGACAGLAYVLLSMTTDGLAANTDAYFIFFGCLGLYFALVAYDTPDSARQWPLFALAGLAFGLGLLVKYCLIFDMAAFALGWLLLTTPTWRALPGQLRRSLPLYGLIGLCALAPTLLIMLVYALAGQFDAFASANLRSYPDMLGGELPLFNIGVIIVAIADQFPLWIGAAMALLGARAWAGNGQERRAIVFLVLWAGFAFAAIVFMRNYDWHCFLQLLPPLSLLAGFALGRGLLAPLRGRGRQAAVLTTVALFALLGVAKATYLHAVFITKERLTDGEPLAGDNVALIARDLGAVLAAGDTLYVFDHHHMLYHKLGVMPPTRLAYAWYLVGEDAYGLLDAKAEIARILAQQPTFIVVGAGTHAQLDAAQPDADPVTQRVLAALASEYRLWRSYPEHRLAAMLPFARIDVGNGFAAVYAKDMP